MVSEYATKDINGEYAFISGTEEKIALVQEALAEFLIQVCNELQKQITVAVNK